MRINQHFNPQTMSNTRQRDLEDLRESAEMERQMLRRQAKQEVEKARSETSVLKQENLMLQEDVQNMKGRLASYDDLKTFLFFITYLVSLLLSVEVI